MMDKKDWSSYWRDSNPPLIARIGFNIEKKSIEKTFKKIKLNKNIKIIDFGCGEGRTLSCIKGLGFTNSYGVDYSRGAIERCHRKGVHDVRLVNNDFKDSCELLFSEGLLEHYDNLDTIARKMAGMSKKYIFLIQPLKTSFSYRFIDLLIKAFGSFNDYIKENSYSIDDYFKTFKKYGFSKKIIKTTHGLPLFIDTSIIIVLEKEKK
jgi:2-polyprenyl-3-methyl-5-hydroxy-6-metoxy-1,4-benzoquinol methylase